MLTGTVLLPTAWMVVLPAALMVTLPMPSTRPAVATTAPSATFTVVLLPLSDAIR